MTTKIRYLKYILILPIHKHILFSFKKNFVYLFLEKGKGGRDRGRETSISCPSHAPNQGPGPQPTHVP